MSETQKVLAVVGMSNSGKGTITDHLEAEGYKKVYFGGMVYDEVARRGLDVVTHEREVREDMRKLEGMDVMAKRAAIKADEYFADGAQTVVFDGLYSWSEYKYLHEKYGENLIVVAVFTPKQLRYDRAEARRDGKRIYTREDVIKRDHEEIENIEKGGPIAMADFTLVNTDSIPHLQSEADVLIAQLQLKP